jgi:DNA-binding CsgD family transcriptional regulator/tetratricopeptide (TPR) repeat protein
MAGWGAFIGRERELSRLQAALAGRVRLVLVVGDAGIGKTRFVGEGLRRAAATGMLTVGGGCLPLAEKLPLLPLADALDELSRLDGGRPFEAALTAAPAYARSEVPRLLPRLGAVEPGPAGPVEGWRREALFAGMAELLGGVARRSPVGLLIEDVHWADGATLDFLTYLTRSGRASPVAVVVTCRGDEAPLDAAVADWLTHVRRDAGVEEIRLGPLSQGEVAEQITALVGAPPLAGLVEEVYARGEGHPFFTEQLVAAAVTADSGQRAQPVGLPERLAELLVARAARCGGDARTVLNALAVAGRPLPEDMLGEVTRLDPDRVRAAVHELAVARLLAVPADEGHRPRHALLAEAVTAELLPGERVLLHERVAGALESKGDETLAAEVAGHWAAASRTGEELQARLTAASAAEQVFSYADAATHWQRAIALCQIVPEEVWPAAVDMPHLYIRAVDALEAAGRTGQAGAVAEEAYRRFADHPDRATAAVVHLRAGYLRMLDSPAAGRPLMSEALRLSKDTPPSAEHAEACLHYHTISWHGGEGSLEEALATLDRGLQIAEAADATTLQARILSVQATHSFVRADLEEGLALLHRARSIAEASADGVAVLTPSVDESDALLNLGRLEAATATALHGLEAAFRSGRGTSFRASRLIANAVDGLLSRGRSPEAAALIDSQAMGPVDWDNWPLHLCRAEIDLLRGELGAAAERLDQIEIRSSHDLSLELGQRVAEVALWSGRPGDAVEEVQRVLDRLRDTDWVIFCGWLLAVGVRACADLAERRQARREDDAVRAALATADDLASWVHREHDVPFTAHPYVASIPAAHATWDAEHGRATGASDPLAWSVAAERWEALDYRHRAGYCWWRQAEAQLAAGETPASASAAMRTAAGAADGHAPLLAEIRALARRARISLDTPPTTVPQAPVPQVSTSYRLTARELDVLRLLTHGRSNAEIGAELFISPRTAGVHITSILRKLGVTNRVQAAALAERAGLLEAGQADGPLAHT